MQKQIRLKLYNTETRVMEEIAPLNGHTILLYTCGPTVYNFAHIGNFRTYVFEDLLRRTLKFFGMQVKQVMNLTDMDDKTLEGALKNNVTLQEFTEPFIKAFFEDMKVLHIEPVEFYPRATEYIPEMVKIIEQLMEKGIAYRSPDGSVYFAIRKFPPYGRLSHLHLDELKVGASERVAWDEYDKENASDFVLWKAVDPARDGNIFWDTTLGKGRPGWHIECSAMAMQILGETIDIHVGGVDNIFPHHENEIAQSECYSGKKFVQHWLHSEHLLVDHKKMSKSAGNFYTLRDLINRGYTGSQVRYMLMQTHYRMQLNFTFQGMDAVCNTLQRLSDFIFRLRGIEDTKEYGLVAPLLEKACLEFCKGLSEDLNISHSLAALFDLVREINSLCDAQKISKKEAENVLETLRQFDTVLCVLPLEPEQIEIPQELEDALQKRIQARAAKNWVEADHYRDFIHSKGYIIEDSPTGARLKKRDKS